MTGGQPIGRQLTGRVVGLALALAIALTIGGSVLTAHVAGAAKGGKCAKVPFAGTISRTEDESQPVGAATGDDIASATVFDFGNRKNFTIYLAEHRLDPKDLGSTIEAPPGEVLVTIFLAAKNGKALLPGQRLRPGRDPVSVIIDAGGGAAAVTTGQTGEVTIRQLSERLVCFSIDYTSQFQRIDGTVRARIP